MRARALQIKYRHVYGSKYSDCRILPILMESHFTKFFNAHQSYSLYCIVLHFFHQVARNSAEIARPLGIYLIDNNCCIEIS